MDGLTYDIDCLTFNAPRPIPADRKIAKPVKKNIGSNRRAAVMESLTPSLSMANATKAKVRRTQENAVLSSAFDEAAQAMSATL